MADIGETAKYKGEMCCRKYPDGGHKTSLPSAKPRHLDAKFQAFVIPLLRVFILKCILISCMGLKYQKLKTKIVSYRAINVPKGSHFEICAVT